MGGLVVLALVITFFFSWFMGGLARLLLPGPDPMPVKHTVAVGFVGTVIGAAIATLGFGGHPGDHEYADFLLALAVTTLFVLAYRRWVRHDPWLLAPDWRWWSRPTPDSQSDRPHARKPA
jgi:uncharacterized membrane protein YeaQ/YmgE (transglycosylase-associated protein family)